MTKEITDLINILRTSTSFGTLGAIHVDDAITNLNKLGYRYDHNLFPPLPAEHDWGKPSLENPKTLAEALLWKMGKWNIYQSFSSHYLDQTRRPKNDVVFYAFAKHLRCNDNPIYDQHALRALWAIDSTMTKAQSDICKSVLVTNNKWKRIANGKNSVKAYELFLHKLQQYTSPEGSSSIDTLDKLLMPLGQAIKEKIPLIDFTKLLGTQTLLSLKD